MKTSFLHQRTYTRSSGLKDTFGDFICKQCGSFVSAAVLLAGVQNRNHCPYCLWSRHLDLYSAGDRLSACKAKMKPIGLTMKKSRNKYQSSGLGELMLVHLCIDCNVVSINCIAADDDPQTMLAVFQSSMGLKPPHEEIVLLQDAAIVQTQLFGLQMEPF